MPVRLPFRQVVALDFEFSAPPGERPRRPVCMVARELHSGRLVRLWEDEFPSRPPFDTGADTLYIAFAIDAELGCHLALGWPLPTRLLDLRIEQLWATNNLQGKRSVVSLLSTLAHYGLDGIGSYEKETFRNLAIRGGPYTSEEREGLLNYCQGDVAALERLLPKMLPRIDLPRALIRGRYMAAVTRMQWYGVPIDAELLERLRTAWLPIQDRMIVEVDRAYGVYEGRSFRERRFVEYLRREQIAWPYLENGRLALDRETFRAMANVYPKLYPLYELRCNLGKLRLSELQVGGDGRNRAWLNPSARAPAATCQATPNSSLVRPSGCAA